MRVLHVNKFHFLRGGAERYLFDLVTEQEARGHTTAVFRMQHPDNVSSPWSEFDAPYVATEEVSFDRSGLRTASTVLYSVPARRRLGCLLRRFEPTVVQFHNVYHQLSTSVLDATRRAGLPAVMAVHDYGLVSPNHALFHDGEICERALQRPLAAVAHRCVKGSLLASAIAGADRWVTRRRDAYVAAVDRFLVPSQFTIDMLRRAGFGGEIEHIPYGIDLERFPVLPPPAGRSVLFYGRLVEGKGVDVVLKAAAQLADVQFRVVGTGPSEHSLRELSRRLRLDNVTFVGFRDGHALKQELERAALVVVPSVWHEVFGLTAAESLVSGRPVIATAMGGLPEVVRDGKDGLVIPPEDATVLAESIRELLSSPPVLRSMARQAHQRARMKFAMDRHVSRLDEIYTSIGAR